MRGVCWFFALVVAVGCAGSVVAVDGGYRHRRHFYTFEAPDGPGPAWKRVEVEGAAIAFRRPGPETLVVQSRCGKPLARPEILARQLIIGIEPRVVEQGRPSSVDGYEAWEQVVRSRDVRLRTVTAVVGDCSVDWILTTSTSGPIDEADRAFDAWRETFQLADRTAGPAEQDS
jgi:hypothetical protein